MPTHTRDDLRALLDEVADDSLRTPRPGRSGLIPVLAAAAAVAVVAGVGVTVAGHERAATPAADTSSFAASGGTRSAVPTSTGPAPFTLAQVSRLFGLPFEAPTPSGVPTDVDALLARTGDPNAVSLGLHRVGFEHDDPWTGKYLHTTWVDVWVIVDRRPEKLIMNLGHYDGKNPRPKAKEYDSLVMWLYDAKTGLPAEDSYANEVADEKGNQSGHDTYWVEPLVRHPAFLAAHPMR